ncbi:MAG: hypothetical protein OXI23_18445 [Gemmatimonadota bacterium]|nr:hypothetical protein [Gemmatimonadota bacterium]
MPGRGFQSPNSAVLVFSGLEVVDASGTWSATARWQSATNTVLGPVHNHNTAQIVVQNGHVTITGASGTGNRGSAPEETLWIGFRFSRSSGTPQFTKITGTATVAMVYENPVTDVRGRLVSNTYQSVRGYVDRQAQYRDGGPIRQENDLLTSPIDVFVALLRDKNIGAGEPSTNVSTDNISEIRTALGPARIDGQIGIARTQGFEGSAEALRAFGIILRRSGDQYQFQDVGAGPVALLTDQHITQLSTNLSPLSEIYTEYLLSYRYSRPLGQHSRHIVADPYHIAHTTSASVRGDSIVAAGMFGSVLPGYRVHIEAPGISTSRSVLGVDDASTIRVDGEALPVSNSASVWIGPHFSYRCYLSAQKYGDFRRKKDIKQDLIADEATAQQVIDREISYHTVAKYRAEVQAPIGAARINEGDRICLDHIDLPAPLQSRKVARYPNGLPYAQTDINAGLIITDGDAQLDIGTVCARSGHDVEVLRVDGHVGRGSLDTLRQNWPASTALYHQPHTWIVTRRSIDPENSVVSLRTETWDDLP